MIDDLRFIQKFVRGKDDLGNETIEFTSYTLQAYDGYVWYDIQIVQEEEEPRLVVADGPPWGEE